MQGYSIRYAKNLSIHRYFFRSAIKCLLLKLLSTVDDIKRSREMLPCYPRGIVSFAYFLTSWQLYVVVSNLCDVKSKPE